MFKCSHKKSNQIPNTTCNFGKWKKVYELGQDSLLLESWCILENWISIVALHIIETTHIVSLDIWTMYSNFWLPSFKAS